MRGLPFAVAVCGVVVLALAIRTGGARLAGESASDATAAVDRQVAVAQPEAAPAPESRTVAPPVADDDLPERVEPRAPLSDLSLALPPKPPPPEDWKGTMLYQPVAASAGTIEAKGYRIALAGVDPVEVNELCTSGSVDWPCGMRARTAFRLFLRGRAVTCLVPPEPERALVVAACSVGGQDVGQWLVENGWARASAGGPYAEAGEAARKARRGMFGAPAASDPEIAP